MVSIVTVLALGVASSAASAKDLYVDAAAGNDSTSYAQNGPSSPWQSLGRAAWGSTNRSSPNQGQAAQAGDVVIVRAGTYVATQGTGERYEPVYNPANSGTAAMPIVFQAEGQVILESRTSGIGEPIVGTYQRDHITWDGFYINEANVNTTIDTGPLVVWASNGVTIQNFTIEGHFHGWSDNHNAIRLEYADNALIRNNVLRGYSESQNNMNASVITAYDSRAMRIENNEISDANTGIFIKGRNIGPVVIRFNRISDVESAVIFGGIGIPSGSEGAIAYGNIITNAWAGFSFIGYDNVSPADVIICNNTMVGINGQDGGAILLRNESAGYRELRFYNNLVANSDYGVAAWHTDLADTTFAHNNYDPSVASMASVEWTRYGFSTWQSRFGKDNEGSGELRANFVDMNGGDFRLASNSEVRTSGRDYLDLDNDGSTSDTVAVGAYALGNEVVGLTTELLPPPPVANIRTPSPPTLN